jgi:hypothetical protein
MLTSGNVSDVKAAPALLERAGPMRYLLGDKVYDVWIGVQKEPG